MPKFTTPTGGARFTNKLVSPDSPHQLVGATESEMRLLNCSHGYQYSMSSNERTPLSTAGLVSTLTIRSPAVNTQREVCLPLYCEACC